jgi:hypothetical protein
VTAQPPVEPPEDAAAPDPAVVEAELDDVARALDRLDEGTYGTCEVCGVALGDEVLAAAPAARDCGGHAPVR